MPIVLALAIALAIIALTLLAHVRRSRREQFIRAYSYPPGLFDRLARRRPELEFKDIALVSRALRHFFLAHLKGGRQFVSMPSQVADDLWHEFILYTKNYEAFCRQAFGTFLHHTPAVVLGSERTGNTGLRRTWWWCCREENIDPKRPSRLPLLFALDAKLNIPDGFRYAADCTVPRLTGSTRAVAIHCGTDFSNASFDGGTSGFGDYSSSHSSDHSGGHDGGGDAGGGDAGGGGGCGGGGD